MHLRVRVRNNEASPSSMTFSDRTVWQGIGFLTLLIFRLTIWGMEILRNNFLTRTNHGLGLTAIEGSSSITEQALHTLDDFRSSKTPLILRGI